MKSAAFTFLILLAGCSTLDQATQDAIACQKDRVCYELAKDRSNLAREVASSVYPIAAPVAGAIVMTFGLWLGGRKKRIVDHG